MCIYRLANAIEYRSNLDLKPAQKKNRSQFYPKVQETLVRQSSAV